MRNRCVQQVTTWLQLVFKTTFFYLFCVLFVFNKHLGLLGPLWGGLTQNSVLEVSHYQMPVLGYDFMLFINRQCSTKRCPRAASALQRYSSLALCRSHLPFYWSSRSFTPVNTATTCTGWFTGVNSQQLKTLWTILDKIKF